MLTLSTVHCILHQKSELANENLKNEKSDRVFNELNEIRDIEPYFYTVG